MEAIVWMSVHAAEAKTRRLAHAHYENFPVGSLLVPKQARQDLHNLYAFMRTADDIADEPGRSPNERLELLGQFREELERLFKPGQESRPRDFIFTALAQTIRRRSLSIDPLARLLEAFSFDVHDTPKFFSEDDLYWYTARSAEPVGELMLVLFDYRDPERIAHSNAICTALQLINFAQDASVDLARGRCYFPLVDFPAVRREDPVRALLDDAALGRSMVEKQVERAQLLLAKGLPLLDVVTGRLRLELRAIVHDAIRMIQKIEREQYDTIRRRPSLSAAEHFASLAAAVIRDPKLPER